MNPISIIIPTLNEVGSLNELFARIDNSMEQAGIPYEIVLVDDHSTDGTTALAHELISAYPVQVLTKRGMPGKAYSLLEGFSAANYDLLCMIDGDLQYPPEAIAQMYHKMQYCEADVVLTRRIDNKTSAMRRLSSGVFNFAFAKMLFGINYDTQSGLKLFRRSVLKTISLSPSPWTFDLEFIVRALEQGYVLVSHDITFSERTSGVPKVKLVSATYELASGSLKLWRNSSPQRVKNHFKHLELLERNYGWLIGVVVGAATITATLFGGVPSASALLSSGTEAVQPPTSVTVLLPADATITTPTPSTSPSPTPVLAAPEPTVASPATQMQVFTPVAIDVQPVSVVSVVTPTISTASTVSQLGQNNSNSVISSNAGSNDAHPSRAIPRNAISVSSTLTPNTTSNRLQQSAPSNSIIISGEAINPGASTKSSSSYYRPSHLALSTTQRLLHAATLFIAVGAALIVLGLLWMSAGKLFKRFNGQVIRI